MRSVVRTTDFRRIAALPRRDWRGQADLADALTTMFRVPGGTMAFRPEQAVALAEAHDARGLFFQGEVGIGKTLVSLVLPSLLEADKALLLIPAGLRQKTVDEFRAYLRHFGAVPPRIESYEKLSIDSGKDVLSSHFAGAKRAVLILDEAQKVKNPRAAAARRIDRLVDDLRGRGTELVVVAMSGTLAKRSIRDLAHILAWCVPNSPLPSGSDLYDWACAVDEKVPDQARIAPGVLLSLPGATGEDPVDAARRAVGSRIFATAGAVGVDAPVRSTSLAVNGVHVPLSLAEDEAFRGLRENWETPDGQPIADAVELWRHAREMACGFFGRWDPAAPQDWLEARRAWASAVRSLLSRTHRPLDTEFQVALEVVAAEGKHPLDDLYRAWKAIEPSFVPNPVPVWLGETALRHAAAWAQDEGIIWTEHVPFGRKLEELTGIPYHGRKGLDSKGRYIESAKGVIAASIHANSVGRNLQKWNRGLITSCRGTGLLWEQLLGRLDRSGQTRDVTFDVALSCREQIAALEQARRDANFHADLLTARARLRYASITLPVLPSTGWAWS